MKIIRSVNTSVKELDNRVYVQTGFIKPVGLWYSINNEWIHWCENNIRDWVRPYNIDLEIDLEKILIIDTKEKLIEFSKDFSVEVKVDFHTYKKIDWNKVTKQYSGIEFQNFWEIKWKLDITYLLDNIWYAGLDCSSGCIWDLSCIKNQKLK